MIKRLIVCGTLLVILASKFSLYSQNGTIELSFDQAMQLIKTNNKSLKVAEKELEWAKSEKQRLNAYWYPQITASGAYVHMANKIEVKESLSTFTDPMIDHIHQVIPNEQLISGILNNIGKSSFSVPLLPQNMTTVDAIVTLPLFTGGKRIYANKIGKLMVDISEVNKERVNSDQQVILVETYFALRLGQEIVKVKQETYNTFDKHYQNALKLEANGLINKAERLFFQVNRAEAERELEVAKKDLLVAQNAFKTLVSLDTADDVAPISNLFINEELPPITYFKGLVSSNNYLVNAIELQKNIQHNELKIAKSAYLPNIELFGKQTFYANGMPKNLIPRSMIGVGFSWNIFDGLDREKKIRQAKIKDYILEVEKEKLVDDISILIDKFYTQTENALDNVKALRTTVEMAKELVRTRQKAFIEGMATSTEVIDAELLLSKVKIATLLAYYQFDSGLINLLASTGMSDTFYNYSETGKDESHILN